MQPQDSLSVSRRPLDIEDYIDILRRHKAWIFGPMFAALVASVVGAYLWPDTYLSYAIIRVVPPQVPEAYVPANVTVDMQGRVNSMTQVVESRAVLTNIINAKGLYKKELGSQPLDDVIENMKKNDIKIGPVRQLFDLNTARSQYPAFSIGFQYSNRFIAQQVCTELVSRFLIENQREISQQTVSTTGFLKDEWDTAKQKLDDIEQKLSLFRAKNMGRLPEEQQANYNQLNALQVQMVNIGGAMSRVTQEKLLLENQLRDLKDQRDKLRDPNQQDQVAAQKKNEKLAEKEKEITQLEEALTRARERYKDAMPEVQSLIARVETAKKEREALEKEELDKKPEAAPKYTPSPLFLKQQTDLESTIRSVQARIEAEGIEMADLEKQAAQLNASMKNFESRLEGVPVGIKEYDELTRDKELAKREFEDLDKRLNSSEQSTMLQNRQQGERLEQLDEPNLPRNPIEPKRYLIIPIGTGIGLILGIFLAGAREVKDSSLKNLKDVRAYTQLPVLGSIPLLENDLVVRRRKRLSWLAWSTACLIGVVIMSSSVIYYFATKV
jgi:polysaccharide biosynthesis transport protein